MAGKSLMNPVILSRYGITALVALLAFLAFYACSTTSTETPQAQHPAIITVNHLDPASIDRISRFRSAAGHDYSDDFESCRSMKHYFHPADTLDWSQITIFCPLDGTITEIRQEWAGTQYHIQSDLHPAYTVILFHIAPQIPYQTGDHLQSGQVIGTHIGYQTMSDLAVRWTCSEGTRLVSAFELMTEAVLTQWKSRGVTSLRDLIISRDARDADPLACDGENFTGIGNLADWFTLERQ